MDDSLAKELVEKLKSYKTVDIKDALSQMHHIFRDNEEMVKNLQTFSVVDSLVVHLQNAEICNISLKVIAECCRERWFIKEFTEAGGIKCLNEIIKITLNNQNFVEACFVLERMSKYGDSDTSFSTITVIPNILQFLSLTDDTELQYAACHAALMILQKNRQAIKSILKENDVKIMLNLLNSSNIKVLMCVIKILFSADNFNLSDLACETPSGSLQNAEDTGFSTVGYFLLPHSEINVIEVLLELSCHSDEIVQNYALISLIDICLYISGFLFSLFPFNAIKKFIEILFVSKQLELKNLALIAISSYLASPCHKEESNILFCLENLTKLLKNKLYCNLHSHVLYSLSHLLSNDTIIANMLLDLNLIDILSSMLKEITQQHKYNHVQKGGHLQFSGSGRCNATSAHKCMLEETSAWFRNLYSCIESTVFDAENSTVSECGYEIFRDDKSIVTKSSESVLCELFSQHYTEGDNDLYIFRRSMAEYKIVLERLNPSSYHIRSILKALLLSKRTLSLFPSNILPFLEYAYYFRSFDDFVDSNFDDFVDSILVQLITDEFTFKELILNKLVLYLDLFDGSGNDDWNFRNRRRRLNFRSVENGMDRMKEKAKSLGFKILKLLEIENKLTVLHALSKLVTSKQILKKMLIGLNGLRMLNGFLSSESFKVRMIAGISVCEIYKSISPRMVKRHKIKIKQSKFKLSTCRYRTSAFDVQFSLDNGETFEANRQYICEGSKYFEDLLMGDCIESRKRNINLRDFQADNVNIMFHFLHGCGPRSDCYYMKYLTISQKLSLLADCDRCLISELKQIIEEDLRNCLDYQSVPGIYEVSKMHNCPNLADDALKLALCISRSSGEWWICFGKLMALDSRLNVLSDIEKLVTSHLDY